MNYSENNLGKSTFLMFHFVGYGLLLFVLCDLIDVIFPLRVMNPVWEFQTIGAIVERVPLPLLGFILIFYGETNFRSKWELGLLKFLSQIALVVGVLFLLLIPLCVSDSIRINNLNNERINTQISQQTSQIQQFEQQLNKATSQDLATLLTRINTQSNSSEIKNTQDLKNRLLTEVDKSERNLKTQVEATRKNRVFSLIKNSVKWSLGALIAGDLFIRIWQATRWARVSTKRKLAQ